VPALPALAATALGDRRFTGATSSWRGEAEPDVATPTLPWPAPAV